MAEERPSTPRGDAELVDFDALEQLEVQQQREEEPGAPAREQLSGPKQWEQWFSSQGLQALKKESEERDSFKQFIEDCEWELIVNKAVLEEFLTQRLRNIEENPPPPGSTAGALITVTERHRFVCDALNDALLEIHALLVDEERVAAVGASSIGLRLSAMECVLSEILPCCFNSRAAAYCEEIVRLLQGSRLGLLPLLRRLVEEHNERPGTCLRQVEARFVKLAASVRKLLDCACTDWNQEAVWRAHAVHEAAAWVMTAPHPVPCPDIVEAFRTKLKLVCNHSPGRGRGCVIRTSVREITLLLHELRSAFKAPDFQSRYQELRSRATQGERQTHGAMLVMTFEVHGVVLPRYGFEASSLGLMSMFDESDLHADQLGPRCGGDKLVAMLRLEVCQALDCEVERDWNHHGRTFTHEPIFHTVGDSHSTVGWPAYVCRHFQGPLLCYNADRIHVLELQPPLESGDALCFCLGEIDCRVQVHKRATDGVSYREVIDSIIARYFSHLCRQAQLLPQGARLLVFNVPPPQRKSVLEHSWIGIPCKGEDEERRTYVLYFNERLRKECQRCGFTFFDVYDSYTDADGFLDARYSDCTVHISNGIFIEEFIKTLRLKRVRKGQVKLGECRRPDWQEEVHQVAA